MAGYFEILCGITAFLTLVYYYFTEKFNFWKSRGIPGPKPVPIFGNVASVMFSKESMGDYLQQLYQTYKGEPLIGMFVRKTPVLIVSDLELIKNVLIKDFSTFSDRGLTVHEKADPLSQHLFNLQPDRWRPLRTKLSPVFTSGKLKGMFNLITQCAKHLEGNLDKIVEEGGSVECRELTARYTTDVIGACAFGLEINALANEDCEFRRMGRKVFEPGFYGLLRFRLRQSLPMLYDIFARIAPVPQFLKFFTKVIKDVIEERKKSNIVRNDFIDMLIDLDKYPEKIPIKLTDTLLASQAFVFFAAGFETSSTTMTHALYELARNHAVQDKLRKEIKEVYQKCNGDLTYEIVKDMQYLNKVFKETLRKYPPATFLLRQSVEPYTFSGTKVSIPAGQKVWIPLYAIQHDPDIYPNPNDFEPERFNPEAVDARHPMTYLPFGDGPRNCIGSRFALFQTKIGLITVLRNFKVDVCEKTLIPYKKDPRAFVLTPMGGLHLKLIKVE